MRMAVSVVAAGFLACMAAAPPAHAKTCKDTVSAKARSAAQLSDASRERRARDGAIANWSKRARDTNGWAYRFWSACRRAQGRVRRRQERQALHGYCQAVQAAVSHS